jgi:hypothetical protein
VSTVSFRHSANAFELTAQPVVHRRLTTLSDERQSTPYVKRWVEHASWFLCAAVLPIVKASARACGAAIAASKSHQREPRI